MDIKRDNSRLIIKCPYCKQDLGVPRAKGTLHITCPKCKNEFEYAAESPRAPQKTPSGPPPEPQKPTPETPYEQPVHTASRKRPNWFGNRIRKHPIFSGLVFTLWIFLLVMSYTTEFLSLISFLVMTVACCFLWLFGTRILDGLKEEGVKWYYRKWFVLLTLFFISPLGIILLWAGSRFKKGAKIGLTIAFGLLFITNVFMQSSEHFSYSPESEIQELMSSDRDEIFLEAANHNVTESFCKDMLEMIELTSTAIHTVPEIVRKCGESVVLIEAEDKDGEVFQQGSGFVITGKGAIVTNYHVVESAYSATVKFTNGKSYEKAYMIAASAAKDLAILSIVAKDDVFTPVILGDPDSLQVGERVIAIGNPLGWQNTVSDGLISGIRELDECILLQITTPISPGSSGGPLFNMRGEVIGITTIGSAWGAQNLNFAVPVSYLSTLITDGLMLNSKVLQ